MVKMPTVTVTIRKGEDLYIGEALEVDVVTQGQTVEETLANLKEALALYFEDEPDLVSTGYEAPIITSVSV